MAPVTRVFDLDDPRARDPEVAGAKVAHLAAARALGFPVLDGVVVPAAEAERVVDRAAAALEAEGVGAARRHALQVEADEALLGQLCPAAARLGSPLIVRSSSRIEGDPRWSGAFASMADVEVDHLATAVRSCWASAFAPDALERWEEAGEPAGALAIALLVQRQLRTSLGGTAEVLPDGTTRVVATTGPLGALMSGWDPGTTWRVDAGGTAEVTSGTGHAGASVLGIAELVGDLRRRTGDGFVEWAVAGGQLCLLQCRRAVAAPEVVATEVVGRPGLEHPLALRMALTVARLRGGPGERLVLPWAAALPELPAPGAPAGDPEGLAASLTARAWGLPAGEAGDRARRALDDLRGGDAAAALAELARLRPVDPVAAAAVLGAIGSPATGRVDRLRWEPFLHEVAIAQGRPVSGDGVVEGTGAGVAAVVDDRVSERPPPGSVLVVRRPVPGVAPLLWHASALVAQSGGRAAHLFEVARSVGIPTVVGAVAVEPGDLVAVDGGAGVVRVARRDLTRRAGTAAGQAESGRLGDTG